MEKKNRIYNYSILPKKDENADDWESYNENEIWEDYNNK
jgi:hypothetical protein